jgi:hypothetical protein
VFLRAFLLDPVHEAVHCEDLRTPAAMMQHWQSQWRTG